MAVLHQGRYKGWRVREGAQADASRPEHSKRQDRCGHRGCSGALRGREGRNWRGRKNEKAGETSCGRGGKGARACVPRRNPGLQPAAPVLQRGMPSTWGLALQKPGCDRAEGTLGGIGLARGRAGWSQFSTNCTGMAEPPPLLPLCKFKRNLCSHVRPPTSLPALPESLGAELSACPGAQQGALAQPLYTAPPILTCMFKMEL